MADDWKTWALNNRAPMFAGQRQRWLVLALGDNPVDDTREALEELLSTGLLDFGDPGESSHIAIAPVDSNPGFPVVRTREEMSPEPSLRAIEPGEQVVPVLVEFDWDGESTVPWLSWADQFGPSDLTPSEATVLLSRVYEPTEAKPTPAEQAGKGAGMAVTSWLTGILVTTAIGAGVGYLYWRVSRPKDGGS